MKILIKILPIILISLIFYIFIYNIYPKYQDLLALTQRLNELKNQEEELKSIENLLTSLENNVNIRELLINRERLNFWLPIEPEVENILLIVNNLYSSLDLSFKGTDFSFADEPVVLVSQVMPVRKINFGLKIEPSKNFLEFIDGLEKSVRLIVIKKTVVTPKDANFQVESYYLKPE